MTDVPRSESGERGGLRPESRPDRETYDPFEETSSDTPAFYLYADALEELWFAATYRQDPCFALLREASVEGENRREWIELTGFSNFQYTGAIVGMHHSVRSVLEGAVGEESGEARVAGIFVSEYGGRARLSRELARLHLSLCNRGRQLLLLADPETAQVALYKRDNGGRFVNEVFRLVFRTTTEETQ